MITELRQALTVFRRFAGVFLTYLVVSQAVLWLALYPAFWWVARKLFAWGGIVSINSANIGSFLGTAPGLAFGLLAAVVLLITVLVEAGGFIKLSAVIIHARSQPSFAAIVADVLKSFRVILGPGLLLVVLLIVVLFPLTGSAMSAGFLVGLRIPNFIMAVIEASPALSLTYLGVLVVAHLCAVALSFIFQFMLLGHRRFGSAVQASFRLVRLNLGRLLGFMITSLAVYTASMFLVVGVGVAGYTWVRWEMSSSWWQTLLGSSIVFTVAIVVWLGGILLVAFQLYLSTNRYYAYLERLAEDDPLRAAATSYPRLPSTAKPNLIHRLLHHRGAMMTITVTVILGFAGLFTAFETQLTAAPHIAVVGHRGGPGDNTIENSIPAVEQSIAAGADYVEVDVQRTLDGHYVIFHDATFSRFTHETRRVQDLTLAQIQNLNLAERSGLGGPPVRVPTLEEMIELTKGRIGLFLELKGATADEQMVDDAVAALTQAGVLESSVVMSLDYQIIEYLEQHYPQVTSGFTYVVSLGDTHQLLGDYLIVEEDAASAELLSQLHEVGKKTAIWTINTPESMDRAVNLHVDAVITDYVTSWQQTAQQRAAAHPLDVLVSLLLNW